MKKTLALVSLSLGIALINPVLSVFAQVPGYPPYPTQNQPETWSPEPSQPEELLPLVPINPIVDCTSASRCLGYDEQIWSGGGRQGDWKALLTSIDNSLRYLATKEAIAAYQNYPVREFTLDRVRRSLLRFRELVVSAKSPADLQAAVSREFTFYQSVGNDGNGTVKFTAYYQPVYSASRTRTSVYKYPVYALPSNFKQWAKPHPKRVQLEGKNGLLGNQSRLRGLELFWFRDRLDAYLIHIQGSAQLNLTDGSVTSIGYAGATDYPWTSIGGQLIKDGRLPAKGLTMPVMIKYFKQNPKEMNVYLPRWERFVFFKETNGEPARGSIRVPVTAERSIATDKSLMPPGALALINASFPYLSENERLTYRIVNRYVLDQDTGSAIKSPGRVDYFMGTGKIAGDRAGVTGGNGTLYYLLLKE